MDKKFGGAIWTDHALQRLKERNISQGDAWAAWRRPEQSRYAKAQGSWIYYRTWGNRRIEVVAKQNEKKEWIIVSVWSRQIFGKAKKKSENIIVKVIKWIVNVK